MTDSLRLFVVEDDEDIALLIGKALERAGHQVRRCRTAADALIVLGHTPFDLVLLDHRLPDMTGFDLLQALAREGISAPALLVTAYGDEHLATRALHAGALDYVVKDPALAFLGELPKRAHEAVTRHRLLQTNRLLVEALESARDGIMITDLQGVILHVNRGLEEITGYNRSELVGQTPRLLKSGAHPPEFYALLWKTILNRGTWQGELTNRRKGGDLVEVSLTVSPILDARGQLTHFVGILRDVSERKHLERQLLQAQKMQSLGTLAGGVAHEFNNLLAGINGYATLGLREEALPATAREFLDNILQLSERAATLTRQMLAFARKPSLRRRPSRMTELLRSTAELVGRTLRLDVRLDLPADAAEHALLLVEADGNQLQQALVNLALNARDAQSRQSVVVFRARRAAPEVELTAFPANVPPGDYVVLEVEDRGCGMTPEVLNQALDPFFTTKEVGKGTGLGLPVVFGIVQGHQGHLAITTAPGRGTCVSLYLPRARVAAPRPDAEGFEVGHVVDPEHVHHRHILVVDDEESVRDVIRRFLEIAGHRVRCAASGPEALALLGEQPACDLVILDLMMPQENGLDLFRVIRQQRPALPILLCTGLVDADPTARLEGAGLVRLIRKPFRMNELWYAVNEALA